MSGRHIPPGSDLPLRRSRKGDLVAAVVLPAVMYVATAALWTKRDRARMRSQAMNLVWDSRTRKMRCKEIIFTLQEKGHRVDPVQRVQLEQTEQVYSSRSRPATAIFGAATIILFKQSF